MQGWSGRPSGVTCRNPGASLALFSLLKTLGLQPLKTNFFARSGGSSLLALTILLASAGLSTPLFAQDADASEPAERRSEAGAEEDLGFELQDDISSAAWGITGAEIKDDPNVLYGALPNGLRYAFRSNNQPGGEASIRMLFNVGSRDEEDGEEGAAHFIEHMAFNGSTNIPEGELLPRLERLGLAFGADTNAETWPDYTVYKLDLPNLDNETVDSSFEMLREIASELTIAPDAVEREKGIIVSEHQVRNSVQQRLLVEAE